MRKTILVGAAALALTALGASPGIAATDGPTPSPSAAAPSPGTSVPLDANGVPVVAPGQKIDPYVRSSVVYLTIKWKAWPVDKTDGTFVFTDKAGGGLFIDEDFACTGYVVNPAGYIATAGHCVSPLGDQKPGQSIHDVMVAHVAKLTVDNGYFVGNPTLSAVTDYWKKHLRLEGSDELGAVGKPDRIVTAYWGANVSGINATKGRTARVLGFQEFEQGDAALIKVNEPNMNSLLVVPGDTTIDTGTNIAAVGYAGSVRAVTDADFHPDVKTGTVSAQKTRNDIPIYELDAEVSPGMSGGPTVNEEGQVIGTNSFGINGETQPFNFVGTSQRILELLNSQGVDNSLSQDSQDLRAGLDAYFAGDKATAVAKLTSVQAAQPSNDIVIDYLARSKALPNPAPPEAKDDGGIPVWVWILAGLVLLALVAGAVLFLMSRKTRQPAQPVYAGGYPVQPVQQPVQAPMAPVQGYPVPPAPAAPEPEVREPVMGFTPMSAPPAEQQPQPMEETQPITTQPTQARTQACPACGTQVSVGQRFCGTCGGAMP